MQYQSSLQGKSTESLLAEYAKTGNDRLREEVIRCRERLVQFLAQKFAKPTVPSEDLAQVAWIALIKAADRFNVERATRFVTYAVTCMTGEIKRYFRDCTWSVRVPRSLQEFAVSLPRKQDELRGRLGRAPSLSELAQSLGVKQGEVLEAAEVFRAYQSASLSAVFPDNEGEGKPASARIGAPDPKIDAVVEQAPIHEAIRCLDARAQKIIRWRFWHEWPQQRVARALGISQMHVSRLERQTLQTLRTRLVV